MNMPALLAAVLAMFGAYYADHRARGKYPTPEHQARAEEDPMKARLDFMFVLCILLAVIFAVVGVLA